MNTETKPCFAHTNNIPRIITGLLVRARYQDIISMKFRRNTNKGAKSFAEEKLKEILSVTP